MSTILNICCGVAMLLCFWTLGNHIISIKYDIKEIKDKIEYLEKR